jgi:replicative DNA helicase
MNTVARLPESSRIESLRVPPQSVESEQSLLGGLMLDPQRIDAVAEKLVEADFYRKDHRLIYRAMLELSARGTPCDAVTLADWFDTNGLAEMAGGNGYCIGLANATPGAANVNAYAAIIREKAVLRGVIDKASQLLESAWSNEVGPVELLDRGIADLMAMQKVEARSEYTLRQAMTLAFAEAQRAKELGGRIPGIASGLVDLDRIIGGWHDSDLVVIGARPAQGKTALLLNFATACSLPCGIVSAEQPAQQIGARVMSIKSHVPAERMRNGRFEGTDMRKLENAVGELCDRTCLIYDRSSPSIADVSRIARKWKQQSGIRVLFVDYVQRIESFTTIHRTRGGLLT